MSNFEELKNKIKEIDKQITQLNNKRYEINEEYVKESQRNCRKEIGRCFKKIEKGNVIEYIKVINTDKIVLMMRGGSDFNPYQYPAIHFYYPYDGSKFPFSVDNMFKGNMDGKRDIVATHYGISYEEISNKEFMDKFGEVVYKWLNVVNNL